MDWTKMSASLTAALARCAAVPARDRSWAALRHGSGGLPPPSGAALQWGSETGEGEGVPGLDVLVACRRGAVLAPMDGVLWHQTEGEVRSAVVSVEGLARLGRCEAVAFIERSVALRPLNDLAAARIGLPQFRRSASPELDGRGVLIGIVDTGIDAAHPCFGPRVLGIWDQTLPAAGGRGAGAVAYGRLLRGPQMAHSHDSDGHGTHVAGIAAGRDERFGGVAPGASLLVVKALMSTAPVLDAIDLVFREADRLDMPAVVNLSLGHHDNAHDGTDLLSRYIDSRCGPGRLVVTAAGNEGADAIHAQVQLACGGRAVLDIEVAQPGGLPRAGFVLTAWYAAAAELEVRVVSPDAEHTDWQPLLRGGPPMRRHYFAEDDLLLSTPARRGDREVRVEVWPRPDSATGGVDHWRLELRNRGPVPVRLDAWLPPAGALTRTRFAARTAAAGMKIGSPGCAREALTVAAMTTRDQWCDEGGAPHGAPGLRCGEICDFSSQGPLRDGSPKPDVTAPGAMIVSAASSQVPAGHAPADVVRRGYVVSAGTSMAAPLATGLAALLLQRERGLDPAGLKAALRAHSVIPGGAPGAHDPVWGSGVIDAARL